MPYFIILLTTLQFPPQRINKGFCLSRISLIRNCEKLPGQEHFIVQEYLDKPFLMEGYKFDLRIYILVTSCDPLRIFLYNDGLVRMGTEKYHAPSEANLVSHSHTNTGIESKRTSKVNDCPLCDTG